MNPSVWICTPSTYAGYANSFTNSFAVSDKRKQGLEWCERNWSGEALPAECFPSEIFATKPPRGAGHKLPHLFSDASFWVVSDAAAAVLRSFDLGAGNLYPVRVLEMDRQTPVGGAWFCLNFGNRKDGLLPQHSIRMYDTYVYGGAKAWMIPKKLVDGDLAVGSAVRGGADIWIDPIAADAFFVSDQLGKALKKAKLDKSFHLKSCRVLDPG